MTPEYYDKHGKPITMGVWAGLFEDWKYKVIERTPLGRYYLVSTVWLGLNHAFMPDSKPLIFETMVFGTDGAEDENERYSTIKEAKEGHKRIVQKYKEKLHEQGKDWKAPHPKAGAATEETVRASDEEDRAASDKLKKDYY